MGNPSAVMTAVTAKPSLGVPPDNSKSDPVFVVFVSYLVSCIVLVVVLPSYYFIVTERERERERENKTRIYK